MSEADPNQSQQPPERPPTSATERAQTELILGAVPEAMAFPSTWRDGGGVDYLYRRGSIVVRDWHLRRVMEALPGILPGDRHTVTDVVTGASRITWPSQDQDDARDVREVVEFLDDRVGEKAAAPDHLVYVCGHSCAASEPEVVPRDASPYPSPQVGQSAADPRSRHGQGVKVLVVDTGLVEGAAAAHWWLDGVTGDPDNPYQPNGDLAQDGGHGTFVAGCLRVTAPAAQVHVVDAVGLLPREPDTSPIGAVFETDLARLVRAQLVAGPGEAPKEVPDILVLNFAGTTQNGGPLLAFAALYDDLLQHLKELLILSPAGNEGDRRKNWPGSFSWVVSVGGLDTTWGGRAPWSNHGHNVDVFAPGDGLVNAFATGRYVCTWGEATGEVRDFEGMARWSGTSFATPLVAGLVASRMSTTGQSSRRAWQSLLELAESQAIPGVGPVLYPGQGCGTVPPTP